MRVDELFAMMESVLPLRGGGSVMLYRNPPLNSLLGMLEKSKGQEMRGLIVGSDVFWWDAYDATHGDVAAVYDPSFQDFDTVIEYKKHRLALRIEGDTVRLFSGSTKDELEHNPRISRIIHKEIPVTTTYKNF